MSSIQFQPLLPPEPDDSNRTSKEAEDERTRLAKAQAFGQALRSTPVTAAGPAAAVPGSPGPMSVPIIRREAGKTSSPGQQLPSSQMPLQPQGPAKAEPQALQAISQQPSQGDAAASAPVEAGAGSAGAEQGTPASAVAGTPGQGSSRRPGDAAGRGGEKSKAGRRTGSVPGMPDLAAMVPQLPLPAGKAAIPKPAPAAVPLSEARLQELVQFSVMTRNESGEMQMTLGLAEGVLGGASISVVGCGRKRVKLRFAGLKPDAGVTDPMLAALIESLRGRDVEVVELVIET